MEVEGTGLQDYLALLRRRRANMLIVFGIVALATVFGTQYLDDQYRSAAMIAVERPQIDERAVGSLRSEVDTDLRIQRSTDRVLTRDNLESWIYEFELYDDLVSQGAIGKATSEFRDDVEIISIQAREDLAVKKQGETIGFEVAYYGESPQKALQVADKLAAQYLEEDRLERTRRSEAALKFFQSESTRLAELIAEYELQLAEFKEQNLGALPESRNANVQMLERRQRELDDIERDIRIRQEQRQVLRTELREVSPYAPIFNEAGEPMLSSHDQLRAWQQELIELSSRYSSAHPDIVRLRKQIASLSGSDAESKTAALELELESARRELLRARQQYSADHPDVKALDRKVNNLIASIADIESAPATTAAPPDNPEYQRIQVQINAATNDIVAMARQRDSLRGRIGELELQLVGAPQVEREYLAIQRQYEQAIRDFNENREKETAARRDQQLELSDQGERYVLQRSPSEPARAAFPNRMAIMILGFIFAIGCAFGAVVISEAVDGTVRGLRDLKQLTGMPPIAVIPVLETRAEQRRRTFVWAASIIGVTGLMAYMIAGQL